MKILVANKLNTAKPKHIKMTSLKRNIYHKVCRLYSSMCLYTHSNLHKLPHEILLLRCQSYSTVQQSCTYTQKVNQLASVKIAVNQHASHTLITKDENNSLSSQIVSTTVKQVVVGFTRTRGLRVLIMERSGIVNTSLFQNELKNDRYPFYSSG